MLKFLIRVRHFAIGVVFVPFSLLANEKSAMRTIPTRSDSASENLITKEKIELGRKLFFEKRLSATKTVSCNSCHNVLDVNLKPPSGVDNLPSSIGVFEQVGGRNAPTVLNSGLRSSYFWDGRASSLEEQAIGPILNPVEMGMMNAKVVETALQNISEYREEFKKVFADAGSRNKYKITIKDVAKAIASFERTLLTPDSPFDRFQKGDISALGEAAQRGWTKFRSHGCIACHAAPTFDNKDYFIRFPMHLTEVDDENRRYHFTADMGRFKATGEYKDRNLWRVPSLQNVALTSPYFHNGAVKNLDEAVRIMAKAQLGKVLPESDVKDIVEFLNSLTGKLPKQNPSSK